MLLYIFLFVFGTIIGSFLNVLIYRIPRKESIVFPSSHCTKCGHELKPFDLIPIISFITLKGRCRYCGAKISLKYPLVELLTGLVFITIFYYFGLTAKTISYIFLSAILITISFIDIEYKIIPNELILTGILGGIVFRLVMYRDGLTDYIIGFLLGAGILFLISVISGGGMGGGDIKLMALIGLFVGWKLTLTTMFIAVILGAICGIILILLKIKTRKDYIPFGPYIAVAWLISILYGCNIINFYIKLISGTA
ncbi:prepilin peptidase [Aceticella autotrophica]|uniref:Prepilin leader peptidase/N-methyltransferase n=1 Tax=Aceticella autotrophica TaxID=2755338 RepID=A0A975AXP6_9THEO|nr:prepilin peptidase [Aceticella autotrophica]